MLFETTVCFQGEDLPCLNRTMTLHSIKTPFVMNWNIVSIGQHSWPTSLWLTRSKSLQQVPNILLMLL